ncbi:MAG: hypothetical protein HUJ90_07350, partial [Bacteroidales bacterium]|nr:hypothetical protein [Bacteroidales bacterium]
MQRILLIAVSSFIGLLCPLLLHSEGTDSHVNVNMDARIDFRQSYIDSEKLNSDSGFKGRYLNLIIDGQIAPNLKFAYRQRLNKMHSSSAFFDATDWLHLDVMD